MGLFMFGKKKSKKEDNSSLAVDEKQQDLLADKMV